MVDFRSKQEKEAQEKRDQERRERTHDAVAELRQEMNSEFESMNSEFERLKNTIQENTEKVYSLEKTFMDQIQHMESQWKIALTNDVAEINKATEDLIKLYSDNNPDQDPTGR